MNLSPVICVRHGCPTTPVGIYLHWCPKGRHSLITSWVPATKRELSDPALIGLRLSA